MADYVAHQVYENIPEYKGIKDNIIDGTETINVQRWKYEAQLEWVQQNVPQSELPTQVSGTSTTVSNSSVWDAINTGNVIGLDALHSGNGSNLRTVKRMELIYKDIDYKFAVNPSDYTQKEPNRVNITQTKGGAWIDAWGAGLVEFNIKGITGVFGKKFTATKDTYLSKLVNTGLDIARVLSGDSGVDVGYQRWKELRDLFRQVYRSVQDGEPITDLIQFYNFTDNEYWYCYPSAAGIELYRSKSKPHVYQYTLNLIGLRRIGEPQVSVGVIGNPYKEQSTNNSPQVQVDSTNNDTSEDNPGVNAEGNAVTPAGENSRDSANPSTNDNTQTATNQKDSTATVGGGNSYKTKAAALNTGADVTVITNTRTKSTEVIRNQSKEHADSMAPIIGGSQGLLIPTTAYNTAKDLAITSVGTVLHVVSFDQNNVLQSKNATKLPKNRLVQEIKFIPQVSSETYNTWKLIREYSPEIMIDNLIVPGTLTAKERIIKTVKTVNYYGSTLYEYTNQYRQKYYLTKTDVKYLKTVLIDAMTLYIHLYKVYNTPGQLSIAITMSDIENLIKNVESLILYLEFNSTDINTFYIQNIKFELRQLESILHQVKSDIIEYL